MRPTCRCRRWCWPGRRCATADPDRAALTVLDGILSTGECSRLYRALVYDQQIATQVGSSADCSQQAGELIDLRHHGRRQDAPTQGVAALRAEVAKLRDAPVTAAELAEAKNELVADALRERETIDDRASVAGLGPDQHRRRRRRRPRDRRHPGGDRRRHPARGPPLPDRRTRSITIRYLAADDAHPATAQNDDVDAPVHRSPTWPPSARSSTLLPEAQRTPIPAPGAAVDRRRPPVAEFRLANGLRVLVAPQAGPAAGLGAAQLRRRLGRRRRGQGRGGRHDRRPADPGHDDAARRPEIATEIEQLGANVGAGAGSDFTDRLRQCAVERLPAGRGPDGRSGAATRPSPRRSWSASGPGPGRAAGRAELAGPGRLGGGGARGLRRRAPMARRAAAR